MENDFQDGRWYQIAYVKAGNSFTTFVNGVADHSATVAGALTFNQLSGYRFGSIGIPPDPSLEVFTGALDDIRIYSRALSALEVQELFANEAVGKGLAVSAEQTPGGLAVRFPAAPNVAYSIHYARNLPAVLWQKLADVPAAPTNRIAEVLDPAVTNAAQRYYRVVAPPQP